MISAVAFVLLVWRELHHDEPMVDLRLMKNPSFSVTFLLMLMLGFMLFGSTFLIPAYSQQLHGYRAVDAGMVLSPGGIITILLLPLVGRTINKVDLRVLAGIGLLVGAVSLLLMTNLYLGVSFRTLMLLRMLQSASLPFLFLPINQMAFRDIPPDKTNNASALINLARNFGGSLGIAVRIDAADAARAVSPEPDRRAPAVAQPRLRGLHAPGCECARYARPTPRRHSPASTRARSSRRRCCLTSTTSRSSD